MSPLNYFFARHWRSTAGLAAFSLAIGALEAANLAAFLPMIETLVGAAADRQAKGPAGLDIAPLATGMTGIADPFVAAGLVFMGLTVLKAILSVAYEYVIARFSADILHRYRNELLERYRRAPLAYFEDQRAGGIVYNLSAPPGALSRLLYFVFRAVVDLLRLLFVLGLLFYVEPRASTAIAVLALAVYFLFLRRLSGHSYGLSRERRGAEQEMNAIATEWIHGIRSIRIADADAHWVGEFARNSGLSRLKNIRLQVLLASPRHVFEAAAFLLLLGVMLGSYVWSPDQFRANVATIGFFAMGLARVLPSVATLTRAPLDIRTTLPDVEILHDLLTRAWQSEPAGGKEFPGLRQGIRLEGATVSQPGRGTTLDGIDLALARGTVTAFVGPSGAGKTTLVNAVLGIQPLTAGAIRFDGDDVSVLDRGSLMRNVGYVGQDVLLFKGSVAENIAYFRTDVSREAIRLAASRAEIAGFIEGLGSGYDSPVGEGGVNFSGGQAQRLAIARALVGDPGILVLDEATSALDGASEAAVMESVRRAAAGRTVLMISHRLASVRWADTICVLEGGRLVQQGDWDTLTRVDGPFRRMCRDQGLAD